MSEGSSAEEFILSSWEVSEGLVENGFVKEGIQVLFVLLRKGSFTGYDILECRTRLRLGFWMMEYTVNFEDAKNVLEVAIMKLKGIEKSSNDKKALLEIREMILQCYRVVYMAYNALGNFVLTKSVLKSAISYAKERNYMSWVKFFQMELLPLLKSTEDLDVVISEIDNYLTELEKENCQKKEKAMLAFIFNLTKLHCMSEDGSMIAGGKLEKQIQVCENLSRDISGNIEIEKKVLGSKGKVSKKISLDEKYWSKNFNFLILSLYKIVLKADISLLYCDISTFDSIVFKMEAYFQMYHKIVHKQKNDQTFSVNQRIRWMRPVPVFVLSTLFTAVLHRIEGKVDPAEAMIEKGLARASKALAERLNIPDGITLDIPGSTEVVVLLMLKEVFLYNKILNCLTKGDFSNAVITLKIAKSMIEKFKFLKGMFNHHFDFLFAVYLGIAGKTVKCREELNKLMIDKNVMKDGQVLCWIKIVLVTLELFEYSTNKKTETKSKILSELDKLQKVGKVTSVHGLKLTVQYLRGALCLLSGVISTSEQYLRPSWTNAKQFLKSNSFLVRVLNLLGSVYTIQKANTIAKKCFESAQQKQRKSKDIVSTLHTFELIKSENVEMDDTFLNNLKNIKDTIQKRIGEAKTLEKMKLNEIEELMVKEKQVSKGNGSK